MDLPIDLPINPLTLGGASALAFAVTQLVKCVIPKNSHVPRLLSIALGVSLVLGYGWIKGLHEPSQLADLFLLGLVAGVGGIGTFEAQKTFRGSAPKKSPAESEETLPVALPADDAEPAVPVGALRQPPRRFRAG
jgi:hypothetical protein